MNGNPEWLPPLVLLADYDGEWEHFLEAVYGFFRQDFVTSRPQWNGTPVGIKRSPVEQGKEAGFWHLITEGRTEADRLPDIRRCERIRWPKPIIEEREAGRVKCWRNRRGRDKRVVIALGDFSYVVILAPRKGYILLWTAYCIEDEHRRTKLRKEYEQAPKC
jgi:hypothetical protein